MFGFSDAVNLFLKNAKYVPVLTAVFERNEHRGSKTAITFHTQL